MPARTGVLVRPVGRSTMNRLNHHFVSEVHKRDRRLLMLTCCLALSLAGCQNPSWHLAASKKSGTVELCLSNADECPRAGGVSPSSISVYRWDNMHDNELIWDAE